MKRYDQWDQTAPITEVEFGRFALYAVAQAEIDEMVDMLKYLKSRQVIRIADWDKVDTLIAKHRG